MRKLFFLQYEQYRIAQAPGIEAYEGQTVRNSLSQNSETKRNNNKNNFFSFLDLELESSSQIGKQK